MATAPPTRPAGPERPDIDVYALIDVVAEDGTVSTVDYPFRLREINSRDVGALRQGSGGATIGSMWSDVVNGEAGIDTFAQIVWLSRRQNGEPTLPYDRVEFNMADHIDGRYRFKFPEKEDSEPESEVDSPEG